MAALKKVVDTYLDISGFNPPKVEPAKTPNPEGYYDRVDADVSRMQKANLADPKKAERLRIMNERIKRTNRPLEAPEPLPAALQPEPVKAPARKKRETYSATEE